MTDWCDTILGEVLTLQRGFDLPARDRVDGPYPIVSSSGITGFHAVAKVQPPGVVIGRYGSLGSVYWIPEPYWPHNTALWVKDFKGNDPRFISFVLRTISHDGSAAAAVPGVNRNHLHRLPVRVPGLATQRRIAAVLAAFDELIAINERRIELLEDLARSLYVDRFVRHPEFHDDGWVAAQLGDIAAVNECSLTAAELSDPFHYMDISSVGERHVRGLTQMSVADAPGRARRRLRDGDTVWATVRPNRRAHALILDPPADVVASTGFAVLTPKAIPASFLFEFTSQQQFTDYLVSRATGSAYPAVRPGDFEEARVMVPPDDVLAEFDDSVQPIHRLTHQLAVQNRNLSDTRDLLLPRLITGQLDISDVEWADLLTETA